MDFEALHRWEIGLDEAKELQRQLAERVIERLPSSGSMPIVAGADMSCIRGSPWLFGAVVAMRLGGEEPLEVVTGKAQAHFPYRPGFLSFREGPVLLDCFRKLKSDPDVIFFDGQGLAHPRRLGLASHLGLWLSRPSIGCAKTRLSGQGREPDHRTGAAEPLMDHGVEIGRILRTSPRCNPLYISIGHLADLDWACRMTLAATRPGRRIPEPLRWAHQEANHFRRSG